MDSKSLSRVLWRLCLSLAFVLTGFTAVSAIRGFPATPAFAADAVTNGGFETASLAPWVVPASGNNPTPTVSSAQAHSGTYSALLGVPSGPEPLGDSIIYQTITVPASGGTLSYWYRPYTTDTITFDWQDAYITDTSGTILHTISHTASNTQTWTNVTFNMAAYAGSTVRIEFLVHEDGFGDLTSMYVDDVSLTTVVAPPVISKSFGAAAIAPGDTTSLSFTIVNPNSTVALTGVAFTDTLLGLVVATPNGLIGSCDGGTISAVAGSGTISLSGATLPASGSCTFSVNVTDDGTTTGPLTNSVTVTSTNGGTGNTATSSITVAYPAMITKTFAMAAIAIGAPVKLSFTITNINGFPLTGVGFLDVLPGGLAVSTVPKIINLSCGGTVTAIAGSGYIRLVGGTVPASGTCTFSVSVTGHSFGWKTNVTSRVTAANAPPGNEALATILI